MNRNYNKIRFQKNKNIDNNQVDIKVVDMAIQIEALQLETDTLNFIQNENVIQNNELNVQQIKPTPKSEKKQNVILFSALSENSLVQKIIKKKFIEQLLVRKINNPDRTDKEQKFSKVGKIAFWVGVGLCLLGAGSIVAFYFFSQSFGGIAFYCFLIGYCAFLYSFYVLKDLKMSLQQRNEELTLGEKWMRTLGLFALFFPLFILLLLIGWVLFYLF